VGSRGVGPCVEIKHKAKKVKSREGDICEKEREGGRKRGQRASDL